MKDKDLVYTGNDYENNWFFKKYYAGGGNFRYHTFQIALNILNQWYECPTIIETGCQRELDDLGAGMSTSIFTEYISRYGGKLITVDINLYHLTKAEVFASRWDDANVQFVRSDSVAFLRDYQDPCHMVYLDSLDYPLDGAPAEAEAAQRHCLDEFLGIQKQLPPRAIMLADDNNLVHTSGGKPRMLKAYLERKPEWTCLLDGQQTLWVKGL